MQKIIIVDDTDKIIGFKLRNEIDYLVDNYRWSGVWIANSNNQVLMAQRKLTRDKDPGMWGPAVAGTLEEGETYESNAYKEVEEEIGLKNIILELGPKERLTTPRKSFGQWFFVGWTTLLVISSYKKKRLSKLFGLIKKIFYEMSNLIRVSIVQLLERG